MPNLDAIFELFGAYPYASAIGVFLLCGIGLPLPEEIVLVVGGFACFSQVARLPWMITFCAIGIACGDLLPFMLGRLFGPKLLRLRLMRIVISRQRLYLFDRWFRRRGDLVIVVARFVPGLRVVAFFTAATMGMRLTRFLFLDLLGIAVVVPVFVLAGWHFGQEISDLIGWIKRAERGILIASLAAGCIVLAIWWLRRRKKRRALVEAPAETYVGPSPEVPRTEDEPQREPDGGPG